jgi:nucleoside-diphosphate-sugar epimerase
MKVFVAGATGAIGRRLVPLLAARGHEVVAMTRKPERAMMLRRCGAQPVVADALDRQAVTRAVDRTEPEVIVHQMTALGGVSSYRRWDAAFFATNRLRTEGTDAILAAARAAGVRRVVAQSFGNWNYAPSGSTVKREEDPFDPTPPKSMRQTLDAIAYLESAVTGYAGIALRYGNLYGPGTGIAPTGEFAELLRRRRLPIIGDGGGVWSFIHVDDAAVATIAAIERGAHGIYNVVDDEPAAVAHWLPALAGGLGAKQPRRIPVWLGRLAAGEAAVHTFTAIRGASNAKARRELGWRMRFPSWREGFRVGLDAEPLAPGDVKRLLGERAQAA